MSKKAEDKVLEILRFPVTADQQIPITFHFKSSRKDVERVMIKHHAEWIVKSLKEYPMPQRKVIYEKLLERTK